MHNLNLDWIIKIAKDFLDQYTHIQQLIADGEESLQNLTTEGLQQLQDKADNLEALLNEWYETHSSDIANQLADALRDLNAWYTLHENYLDQTLAENIALFNQRAEAKAAEVIETIPEDYTALTSKVNSIDDELTALIFTEKNVEITPILGGAVRVATGVMDTGSDYKYAATDTIAIPTGTFKIVTNINNCYNVTTTYGYAIYDENYIYITGGQLIENIEILPTYKYIRMTNYDATEQHSNLYITFNVGTAAKEIKENYNIMTLGYKEPAYATVNGAIRIDNGILNETSNAVMIATNYIEIPENTYGIDTNFNNALGASSTYGYAFYDENKTFITGGHQIGSVTILPSYKYFRMTDYNSTQTHSGLYIKLKIGNDYKQIEINKENIESLENQADFNEFNIQASAYGFYSVNITPVLGGAIRTDNGILNVGSNHAFAATDYIEIPLGTKFINTNINNALDITTSYGYAFYNANKTFIASGNALDFVPVLPTYRYIRMTNYDATENHANLYASFYVDTNYIKISDFVKTIGLKTNKIYIVGDSIAAGIGGSNFNGSLAGDTPVEQTSGELILYTPYRGSFYRNTTGVCWANMLKQYLESKYSYTTVVNNGCSGINTNVVDAYFDTLLPNDATMAIFYVGMNDRSETRVIYEQRLKSLLRKIIARNIPFLFIVPMNSTNANEATKTFTSRILAREMYKLCYGITEPVGLQTEVNYYLYNHNIDISSILSDELHPNDTGYTIMYNILLRLLKL